MKTSRRLCVAAAFLIHAGVGSLVPDVVAQTVRFEAIGSIPGPADWIEVDGARAFVAAAKTFTLFDIANPAMPVRQGSYAFPERIWGFAVAGTLIYVAADIFGVGVLDVSNPLNLTLKGSFKTPGQAKQVALFGTMALVTDHTSGLDILDVSNPSKPVATGSFFVEGYARDVGIWGTLAVAVDSPTGLYVFDLVKGGATEPVGTLQTPSKDRGSPLHPSLATVRFSANERPTRVALVRSESLLMFDISDPQKPVNIATFRTPSGRPQRAMLTANRLYVADGQEGLIVLDIAATSTPQIIGTFKTASPARDVFVAGSLVFVVIGDLRADSRSPSGREVLILRQAGAAP